MHDHRKRALLLLGLAALSVPLVAAALAHACTAAATLTLSQGAATPGTVVTVTGNGFGTHDPQNAQSAQPAEIRMGSTSAPVLAKASPSGPERSFTVDITIPESEPGDTILVATQQGANGRPVYGTPARQAFTVTRPSPPPSPAAPAPVGAPPITVIEDALDREVALRNAISRCRKRYSAKKAKTARGRRRMARKRSACIRKARDKFSA